jgi:hypothetical protein
MAHGSSRGVMVVEQGIGSMTRGWTGFWYWMAFHARLSLLPQILTRIDRNRLSSLGVARSSRIADDRG